MLTGKAKTDYQREYMRRRRSNKLDPQSVRPNPLDPVRPDVAMPVEVLEELDRVTEKRIPPCPKGISESQWNYQHKHLIH